MKGSKTSSPRFAPERRLTAQRGLLPEEKASQQPLKHAWWPEGRSLGSEDTRWPEGRSLGCSQGPLHAPDLWEAAGSVGHNHAL